MVGSYKCRMRPRSTSQPMKPTIMKEMGRQSSQGNPPKYCRIQVK